MDVVGAEGKSLVARAIDLLLKGLDEIIRADIEKNKDYEIKLDAQNMKKEDIQQEGKLGVRYMLGFIDNPDAKLYINVWPVAGRNNLFYVDKVYGKGKLSDGARMPSDKFGTKEWKPKVINGNDIWDEVNEFIRSDDRLAQKSLEDEELHDGKAIDENTPDEDDAAAEEAIQNREEGTAAATRVRAKLQRIAGSSEIQYTAITATCDPDTAMNMLCDALDCEELAQQVGDEPIIVEISDDGDALDAEIVEDIDTSATPAALEDAKQKLLSAIGEFLSFIDLYSVNFNASEQDTLDAWSERLAEEKEMLGEGRLQ